MDGEYLILAHEKAAGQASLGGFLFVCMCSYVQLVLAAYSLGLLWQQG